MKNSSFTTCETKRLPVLCQHPSLQKSISINIIRGIYRVCSAPSSLIISSVTYHVFFFSSHRKSLLTYLFFILWLTEKALFGEEEWYFFSPRDRKYPKGERPNRAAGLGYWKATGIDKPIFSSFGSKQIGVKKSLVFYVGRPPKGEKTGWYMNEYRLLDSSIKPTKLKGSMRVSIFKLFF